MMRDKSFSRQLSGVARLLKIGAGDRARWEPLELAHIFQHQMEAPLLDDLRCDVSQMQAIAPLLRDVGTPIVTFKDLLLHPSPPVSLLCMLKDFAKTADKGADDPLPPAIATSLYLLAIAAAMAKRSERITSLDNEELSRSFQWILDQNWLPLEMHKVVTSAMTSLVTK